MRACRQIDQHRTQNIIFFGGGIVLKIITKYGLGIFCVLFPRAMLHTQTHLEHLQSSGCVFAGLSILCFLVVHCLAVCDSLCMHFLSFLCDCSFALPFQWLIVHCPGLLPRNSLASSVLEGT